jgi:hypothetical protein
VEGQILLYLNKEVLVNLLNSDYNAYKEAYQIYEDTERTPINLFATPGINWQNNDALVKDALEIIEDIRQDALYIIDAPDANLNDTATVVAGSYVDDLDNANIDSSYAATYVPYIKKKTLIVILISSFLQQVKY